MRCAVPEPGPLFEIITKLWKIRASDRQRGKRGKHKKKRGIEILMPRFFHPTLAQFPGSPVAPVSRRYKRHLIGHRLASPKMPAIFG